jgi:hypothetical protein
MSKLQITEKSGKGASYLLFIRIEKSKDLVIKKLELNIYLSCKYQKQLKPWVQL